jgi:hypothetical protein
VLTTRAAHYGLGIEQFKRRHLLKTESPASAVLNPRGHKKRAHPTKLVDEYVGTDRTEMGLGGLPGDEVRGEMRCSRVGWADRVFVCPRCAVLNPRGHKNVPTLPS